MGNVVPKQENHASFSGCVVTSGVGVFLHIASRVRASRIAVRGKGPLEKAGIKIFPSHASVFQNLFLVMYTIHVHSVSQKPLSRILHSAESLRDPRPPLWM